MLNSNRFALSRFSSLSLSLSLSLSHTHTHTHTHKQSHTHTQTRARARPTNMEVANQITQVLAVKPAGERERERERERDILRSLGVRQTPQANYGCHTISTRTTVAKRHQSYEKHTTICLTASLSCLSGYTDLYGWQCGFVVP